MINIQSVVPFATDPVTDPSKELFRVNFLGRTHYLAQSPQMFKQILVLATHKKLYSLQTYWRAEEALTPRHSLEYWSFDVEMPLGPQESEANLMDLIEDLVTYSADQLISNYAEEMEIIGGKFIPPHKPFYRLTYDEAVSLLQHNDVVVNWGDDLGYEREMALGNILKEENIFYYFIIRWPSSVKKFYAKLDRQNPKYTHTFDFDICGWEIASGAQREIDIVTLKERLQEKRLKESDYQYYLDFFLDGAIPHGGFGLGFDRLLCKIIGLNNVSEVIPFPLRKVIMYNRCEYKEVE
jgi:nondiscriminating aspartyl-tRNA synthetase